MSGEGETEDCLQCLFSWFTEDFVTVISIKQNDRNCIIVSV